MKKKNLLGAHMSAAGGVYNALRKGQDIGATTIQLFTSNQRQWKGKKLTEKEIEEWFQVLESTDIESVMSHDSYLINLGSPKEETLLKSRKTFEEELQRCQLLDISYLNFHPGAALGKEVEECLDIIIESLIHFKSLAEKGNCMLLMETTAGQGTCVGHRFEHLAYVIREVKDHVPIGVCIDTCHIFAAGYDIRTKEGWDKTLAEFSNIVGLEYLKAFHLNDSLKPLGSRLDRHANLGMGQIGLDCFEYLMTNPKTRDLPKYLETPNGDTHWKQEIALLFEFAEKSYAHQN